jgi:predicted ABC-type ATPase
MPPKMIVIAGPPGSGKSSIYPLSRFNLPYFNADDRAAILNGGTYIGIPMEIRSAVNQEFEAFVLGSISKRASFAIETTLRSSITFDQARLAKEAGFQIEMRYLALRDFAMHIERIKARADSGGHSASESTLLPTYRSSLANLSQAIAILDKLWVYDNSKPGGPPRLLLECDQGEVHFIANDPTAWLTSALDMLD